MSTSITLPGGVLRDGRLERSAAFRPLTGWLEHQFLTLAESPVPRRVTRALSLALQQIGGRAVTESSAAELSVSDRQFLMLALALELGGDQQWLHAICNRCAAKFDVGFRLSDLPLTSAGASYPWAETLVEGRRARLRVPTGEDEARVSELNLETARRMLATSCVVTLDGAQPTPALLAALDDEAINAIDSALDDVAPQVAATISTTCRECGAPQSLDIDPYSAVTHDPQQLFADVHALALRYHWSEAQCLRLPRARRQMYLDMIDHSLGVSH